MIQHGSTHSNGSLLRRRVDIPSPVEDLSLIRSAQSGSVKARNELIERHMPGAIAEACKFYRVRRSVRSHVEREDLIHMCVLGMVHAIRQYDIAKARGRFLGYARYWMRHYMDHGVHQSMMFRIPLSTMYQYQNGTLNRKSSTKTRWAIEHHKDHVQWSDSIEVPCAGLSPLEMAICREEIAIRKQHADPAIHRET